MLEFDSTLDVMFIVFVRVMGAMVANPLTETGNDGRRKLKLDGAELRFPAIQFNSSGGGVVI